MATNVTQAQLAAVQGALPGIRRVVNEPEQPLSQRIKDTVTFPTLLKDIPKAVLSVGAVVVPNLDGYGKAWFQGFRCVKNACSGLEFPGKVAGAIHKFETAQEALDYAEGVARSVDVVSSVTDTVALCNETSLFNIDSQTMTVLGICGNAASVLAAGFLAVREAMKLVTVISDANVNYEKMANHLINTVKFICYTALAAIGLVALVFAAMTAPWIIATLAIMSVVTSVGGFFYDKIVDPDNRYGPRIVGTYI